MSEMIPIGASVVDVGSGAGLPGIVLAVARPDLTITLVEPLARRTAFLSEAVTALGLDATVTVVRGRAEDLAGGPPAAADVVTARAVAPLDRLAGWCLPLAAIGGRLLALKGASAADEVAEHRDGDRPAGRLRSGHRALRCRRDRSADDGRGDRPRAGRRGTTAEAVQAGGRFGPRRRPSRWARLRARENAKGIDGQAGRAQANRKTSTSDPAIRGRRRRHAAGPRSPSLPPSGASHGCHRLRPGPSGLVPRSCRWPSLPWRWRMHGADPTRSATGLDWVSRPARPWPPARRSCGAGGITVAATRSDTGWPAYAGRNYGAALRLVPGIMVFEPH